MPQFDMEVFDNGQGYCSCTRDHIQELLYATSSWSPNLSTGGASISSFLSIASACSVPSIKRNCYSTSQHQLKA